MIGQKGFFKANTNSNSNLGDAIISGGNGAPTPPPAPASPNDSSQSPFSATQSHSSAAPAPSNKKLFLAVSISVLATALVGVLAYFIFLAPKNDQKNWVTVDSYQASPDNDGTKTTEDTLNEFDKEIASASSADDKLDLKLNKAGYLIIVEKYDEAITLLDGINLDELEPFDKSRVYNYYVGAYEGLNDKNAVSKYQALANDASSKQWSSGNE